MRYVYFTFSRLFGRACCACLLLALSAGSWSQTNNQHTVVGNVQGLVIPILFANDTTTVTPADIEALFNQQGYSLNGNPGSVRDYYDAMSDGQLTLTHTIAPIYVAPENAAFYSNTNVNNIPALLQGALAAYENNGGNFNGFTTDANGQLASLYFVHLAPSAGRLGPHSSSVTYTLSGVSTGRYGLSSWAAGGTPGINSITHEIGHSLMHWPDLYDTNNTANVSTNSAGIGRYCNMSWGGPSSVNPLPPNPYLRARAGWTTLIELSDGPVQTYSIDANSNTHYRYSNPADSNEFFIVEAVNNTSNSWWQALPDQGLLIWHIDENVSDGTGNRNQDMTESLHYQVSLEQADGLFELEFDGSNGGDTDDAFTNGDEFTSSSVPSSDWWDGSSSNVTISDISNTASTMTFDFGAESEDSGFPCDSSNSTTVNGTVNVQSGSCLKYQHQSGNLRLGTWSASGQNVYDVKNCNGDIIADVQQVLSGWMAISTATNYCDHYIYVKQAQSPYQLQVGSW